MSDPVQDVFPPEGEGLLPYGDCPVACTASGAVYLLEAVVERNPGEALLAWKVILREGVRARLTGIPCAACRTVVSTDRHTEKAETCQYRPLRGPLHVPRDDRSLTSL